MAGGTWRATDACPPGAEWPRGLHWSPGEVRDVPEDWPGADGDAPPWLVAEEAAVAFAPQRADVEAPPASSVVAAPRSRRKDG